MRPRCLLIRNVHLAHEPSLGSGGSSVPYIANSLYDVWLKNGVVGNVSMSGTGPHGKSTDNGDGENTEYGTVDCRGEGMMIPSLAHAHIHLDKCFILGQCDELHTGDFGEALKVTAKAKAGFCKDWEAVYVRGKRLIAESVVSGVTHMRAHVEVDGVVGTGCLDVGVRLVQDWKDFCDVQLCAFAQDPLYVKEGDESAGENLTLLRSAVENEHVSAVGSAPYVEPSRAQAKLNIAHVLDLAFLHAKHADFHLDYNIDAAAEPLIFDLILELRTRIESGRWVHGKWVTVGHATRLTLFTRKQWEALRVMMQGLPISLVGLPQSDLYMMGRRGPRDDDDATAMTTEDAADDDDAALLLPTRRYTLDPTEIWERDRLEVAMAVNNVDNAFTPQGSVDPLGLCVLGVAMFQRATVQDCTVLLKSVTTTARKAIGINPDSNGSLFPAIGSPADFVILHKNKTVQSAALNPSYDRTTIKDGLVVATRTGNCWITS